MPFPRGLSDAAPIDSSVLMLILIRVPLRILFTYYSVTPTPTPTLGFNKEEGSALATVTPASTDELNKGNKGIQSP